MVRIRWLKAGVSSQESGAGVGSWELGVGPLDGLSDNPALGGHTRFAGKEIEG